MFDSSLTRTPAERTPRRHSAIGTLAGVVMGAALIGGAAACLPDTAPKMPVPAPTPTVVAETPATAPVELPAYTLPPCPSEDSEHCYWDAANMGNGHGRSFIRLNGVTYLAEVN